MTSLPALAVGLRNRPRVSHRYAFWRPEQPEEASLLHPRVGGPRIWNGANAEGTKHNVNAPTCVRLGRILQTEVAKPVIAVGDDAHRCAGVRPLLLQKVPRPSHSIATCCSKTVPSRLRRAGIPNCGLPMIAFAWARSTRNGPLSI